MNPSFREILELLNKHQVEYIVVGGVAAVIQGAPVTNVRHRYTGSNQRGKRNSAHARAWMSSKLCFREHQSIVRPTTDDIMAGGHLLLMTRAGPMDVLGFIGDNERYEDLIHASSDVSMTVGSFRVLNLEELVRQKKAANRPKDQAVLTLLEELLRRRPNDN